LKNLIATQVRENGVEGIVVDYLQLVKVNNKNLSVAQIQEEVAQTLAEYSKKYNIWILYASQINRDGQIRNGAGIEQACDWAYEINKNESNEIYLKPIVSRHTAGYSIGSETNRVFRIAEKGTHIVENNIEEKYSYQ
jgi:predicted ATP-dependent serine protease